MESALRISAKSAPFRRAGLVFGSTNDVVEVDPETLDPKAVAQLAADDNLVIEGSDGEGGWEVMPAEIRALAAAQLVTLDDQDWAEIAAEFRETGPGQILGRDEEFQIDPGLLARAAQLDAVVLVLSEHQAVLEGLDLWPMSDEPAIVVGGLITALADSGLALADARQEIARDDERLGGFRAALADYDEALKDPARAGMASAELSDALDVLVGNMAAATEPHTPRDEEQGGGGGDGAASAGGDQSQGAPPETVGKGAQAAGPETPPAKPPRKGGKAANSTAT